MRVARTIAAFVLAALASTCARGAEAKGVLLRLKLEPGQVLRIEGRLDQKITVALPTGGNMVMTNSSRAINRVKVLRKNEQGNYVIEIKAERMKAANKSPLMNFEYDSENAEDRKKEGALLGRFYRLLCDTTFTATVDSRGQILKVAGIEGVRQKLRKAFPEAEQQIKMMLGSGMEKNLCRVFAVLPAAAVPLGGTWIQACDAGKIASGKLTMKLTKQDGGTTVAVPTAYSVRFGSDDPDAGANPMAAMVKHMKATKTSVSGKTVLDSRTGVPRSSTTVLKMDYELKMPGQQQTMKYNLDQTASGRLLPAAPVKKAAAPAGKS